MEKKKPKKLTIGLAALALAASISGCAADTTSRFFNTVDRVKGYHPIISYNKPNEKRAYQR